MSKEIHRDRKNVMNTKIWKERAQSVEELFSDLLAEASTLDSEMKMRFVEAFFYISQKDIRQAMVDFDSLGDADRLIAGYLLHKLARKSPLPAD